MLATFIIALREGLEAALIVGIIAAFLRSNRKPLTALWVGVGLAVLLSLVVGIILHATEHALPQAAQEGMESIIGFIAVIFVSSMIRWMNSHAHHLRATLENETAAALGKSGYGALASMAFLAVLKEGFETCVFLLATFSVAQSATLATLGAVAGLLLACFIGWGIYVGGVHLNLARFFRYTGLFLVLVAAGLVVTSLRSAHEAGWLNIGQQKVLNLSWLVAPGTVQSALIGGILGIPADPRLIELVGWGLYIVMMAVLLCWPARLRSTPAMQIRCYVASSLTLLIITLMLFFFYPEPHIQLPPSAIIVRNMTPDAPVMGTLSLQSEDGEDSELIIKTPALSERKIRLPVQEAQHENYKELPAEHWRVNYASQKSGAPSQLTLDEVVALYSKRVPVGLSPTRHPGPYQAAWTIHCHIELWATPWGILDATSQGSEVIILSGGGLTAPRTITLPHDNASAQCDWQIAESYQQQVASAFSQLAARQDVYRFWVFLFPLLLLELAAILALSALRVRRKLKDNNIP